MDYVDGGTLEEHILEQRLTPDEIDPFARGILAGVASAHARGLIHRDLKPSNVLLERDGDRLVPRVADFGLVKDLGDEQDDGSGTRPNTPMGTPSYMAPEQIFDAQAADMRADVFSLGAMLYELVTGERAFLGRYISEIYDAVSVGRYAPLPADTPAAWREAITLALAGNRDNRPADAGALLALWSATLADPPVTPRPAPVAKQRPVETAFSAAPTVVHRRPQPPPAVHWVAFAAGLAVGTALITAVMCLGGFRALAQLIPAS
jgi:serine/threonine protein kinase